MNSLPKTFEVTEEREPRELPTRRRVSPGVLALVAFGAAFLLRVYGVSSFPQQVDERHWVGRSTLLLARVVRGDAAIATSHLGHPGIPAALAMAAAQRAAGPWNRIVGSRIPQASLDPVAASRLATIFLSSLAVPILFLGALPFLGWQASLLGAALLAFDPQHIAVSRMAHLDGTLSMLVLACFFCFLRSELMPSLRRTAACGVFFGLALATKPTAIALVPAFVLVRLLLRCCGYVKSSFVELRDVLVILIAHLVLLSIWTKLWDPKHNFITFLHVRVKLARWIGDAGEYLGEHNLTAAGLLVVAMLVPVAYAFLCRRSSKKINAELLLALLFIPFITGLLWLNCLPLQNIARFWGWVGGLSEERHNSYGVVVPPPAGGYLELWWQFASLPFWLGVPLACFFLVRRRESFDFSKPAISPAAFAGACFLVSCFWTGLLSVSDKQAFRYVLPVYTLLFSVAAYGFVGLLRAFPRRIAQLVFGAGVVLVVGTSVTSLPLAALSLNPLSGGLKAAADGGQRATPVDYHRALEMAQSLAAPVPESGAREQVEVVGDLELVKSEYYRRFSEAERRLQIVPFRGGLGADWVLEFGRRPGYDDSRMEYRSFAEQTLLRVHDEVELYALYRVSPPKNRETRIIDIKRAATKIGSMRESGGRRFLRVRPPHEPEYAFFDAPFKISPGTFLFRFELRLGENKGHALPPLDSVVVRLEASSACRREILLKDLMSSDGGRKVFELRCTFEKAIRPNLAAFWFGTIPLEIGNIEAVKNGWTSAESAAAGPVVIYGGTPAGIMAAVAVVRNGGDAVLIAPDGHLGGMMSGGLSATDTGLARLIGGQALEFFHRAGAYYGQLREWRFEPHVAEAVFHDMLREHALEPKLGFELSRVETKDGAIVELVSHTGERVGGKVFIDATYEGDLMALAGASYSVGRESTAEFGEALAGFQPERSIGQFLKPISGLMSDGKPLPGVVPWPKQHIGDADRLVPAYNYRLCVTNDPARRVPFPKPESYDPIRFELLLRYFEALPTLALQHLFNFLPIQGGKFDLNNSGPFSSNLVGGSVDYPTGSAARRQEILKEHREHLLGLWWTLNTSERVPAAVREQSSKWGLCSDEFQSNGNWPPQLYIREARRMRGAYVLVEKDVRTDLKKPDSIGMGSKPVESHHVQRLLREDGTVFSEGFVYPRSEGEFPYEIPYRSLTPQRQEVKNLLVPVCVSSSHIAFSSLRMEPVYMILGQAAGMAATLAARDSRAVQDVDVAELQRSLAIDGQVLHDPGKRSRRR